MKPALKTEIREAKRKTIVFAALAAFVAAVASTAAGNHLTCSVDKHKFQFALFSNIKDSNNNKYETTLSELSHFDQQATAFGQYSIAVHITLATASWCAAYEMAENNKPSTSPFWYRTIVGAVVAATLILAGLFIDIAENHSTAGITAMPQNQHMYRVQAYRGIGGYTLQFVPLTLCFLIWVKNIH